MTCAIVHADQEPNNTLVYFFFASKSVKRLPMDVKCLQFQAVPPSRRIVDWSFSERERVGGQVLRLFIVSSNTLLHKALLSL